MCEYMFLTFIVGTAGSGKSLLTAAFERWLNEFGVSTVVANLDPGVDSSPYRCDVDIRNYVDYGEIISTFELGPNGGLVAALDMAVNHAPDIREDLMSMEAEYAIVDCPGQMELFAYRNSGPQMVNVLKGEEPACSVYLLDANIARSPQGYLASALLGMSINLRFVIPQLNVLSKADILTEEIVDEIVEWSSEPETLEQALQSSAEGLTREYSEAILRMLEELVGTTVVLPVSAKKMTGLDNLYAELQRIFMGGDNIE